ncbi:proline-rich receptor-like protein kinase PERK8 [Fagus crenata]
MVSRIACMRFSILMLHMSISATTLLTPSEARSHAQMFKFHDPKLPKTSIKELVKKLKARSHLDIIDQPLDSSRAELFGINSPFSLPPFESIAPSPFPEPENTPPFAVFAPSTPKPPSTSFALSPPPPSSKPNFSIQSPPPRIPDNISSPPAYPPEYVPSPPNINRPSPPNNVPTPPIYLPPLVFPPPTVPPPPLQKGSQFGTWCVAKPTVPDPIIQEAMDYACGSGANCKSIEPNGSCYQPDTLLVHASYAFNSYWQNTKVGGGTCDFGGIAMLVTVDPSFDECHFIYN